MSAHLSEQDAFLAGLLLRGIEEGHFDLEEETARRVRRVLEGITSRAPSIEDPKREAGQ